MPVSYSVDPIQPPRNATLEIHEFVVEADGAGVVPNQDTASIHGWVALVEVVPDSVAPPAAAFDIALNTQDGIDVLGGQGDQISVSAPSQFVPQVGDGLGTRPVSGVLTFTCSNIGASNKVVIKVTVEK